MLSRRTTVAELDRTLANRNGIPHERKADTFRCSVKCMHIGKVWPRLFPRRRSCDRKPHHDQAEKSIALNAKAHYILVRCAQQDERGTRSLTIRSFSQFLEILLGILRHRLHRQDNDFSTTTSWRGALLRSSQPRSLRQLVSCWSRSKFGQLEHIRPSLLRLPRLRYWRSFRATTSRWWRGWMCLQIQSGCE